MHGAAQRVDNCEQQLEFFTKAMVRPRTKADHGHSRGNSAHGGQTFEEEAGYASPTWSILRALQKINTAKRIEGEAIMSAPPFFQSAGRGDLKFWEEDDEPAVVVWESLSESGRSSGWKRWASRRIGWFGAGWGKKTKNNARLKSMEKKSYQTAARSQTQSRREDG